MIVQGGPVASIPLWILLHPKISPTAVRLWGMLHALYGGEDKPNPTRPEMAVLIQRDVSTVEGHLRQLIASGAIERVPASRDADGHHLPPHYILRIDPPADAVAAPVIAPRAEVVAPSEFYQQMVEGIATSQPRIFTPSAGVRESTSTSTTSTSTKKPKKKKKTKAPDADPRNAVEKFVRFCVFWGKYPRTVARDRALRQWILLKIETNELLYGAVMAGLERYIALWAAENRAKHFVPYAARWLRDRSWTDDAPIPALPEQLPLPESTWGAIRERIAERVDRRAFENWFASAVQVSNGNGALSVRVRSRDWIVQHYGEVVTSAQAAAGHKDIKITWVQDDA